MTVSLSMVDLAALKLNLQVDRHSCITDTDFNIVDDGTMKKTSLNSSCGQSNSLTDCNDKNPLIKEKLPRSTQSTHTQAI